MLNCGALLSACGVSRSAPPVSAAHGRPAWGGPVVAAGNTPRLISHATWNHCSVIASGQQQRRGDPRILFLPLLYKPRAHPHDCLVLCLPHPQHFTIPRPTPSLAFPVLLRPHTAVDSTNLQPQCLSRTVSFSPGSIRLVSEPSRQTPELPRVQLRTMQCNAMRSITDGNIRQVPRLRGLRPDQRCPQRQRGRPQGCHEAGQRRLCFHPQERRRRDRQLEHRPEEQGRCFQGPWREADWCVTLQPPRLPPFANSCPSVTLSLSESDFGALVAGKANAQRLFMSGKLKIKGDVMKATKLDPILKKSQTKAKL